MPFFILQYVFQSFFVAAEKLGLSLKVNIAAGLTNAVLDYLLIVVFPLGLAGAAIATIVGQVIGGIVPILYFAKKNDSLLRLMKAGFNGQILRDTCINGSSEMITNLSTSVINALYNFQLMEFAGENGVAAYGVVMYVNIIFTALNNGAVSAAIFFLRTLVFQIIAVLVLPLIFGIDGVWLSIVVAEVLSLAVTGFFLVTRKKRYQYA